LKEEIHSAKQQNKIEEGKRSAPDCIKAIANYQKHPAKVGKGKNEQRPEFF